MMAADPTMSSQIKDGVAAVIASLNLTGTTTDGRKVSIQKANIYEQMVANDPNVEYPLVLLTSEGLTEKYLDGDTTTIQRELPVQVWIADKESYQSDELDPVFQQWRATIALAFHQKKPLLLPMCSGTRVELGVIYDPEASGYQFLVTGLIIWVEVWETR